MDYKSKVAKIYEVMSDKTLSFGCMFHSHWRICRYIADDYADDWSTIWYRCIDDWENGFKTWKLWDTIWHPLHIWHVLDWQNELYKIWNSNPVDIANNIQNTLSIRPHLSQPLPLDPSKEWYEVIDFILWLIE